MKKLIVIIAVFLSGCYQRVDLSDIKRANIVCSEMAAEVLYIEAIALGDENVICTNGKITFNIHARNR